jgi:NAD(P)-dependent dehydrogenase (short-subunit alcohol dehydrogenase family)
MERFRDRNVIVTGAGRGIGEATARRFASEGADVLLVGRTPEPLDGVASAIQSDGGRAWVHTADVSKSDQVDACVTAAVERWGRIDVLINNAGIDRTAPFGELEIEDWDRILAVNLRGPVMMARAVLPAMREAGHGHIVNITSTAAKRAWENASAYHATKWGLLGLSHALHTEARRDGIKVTAMVCGGMRTPFLLDRFPELDPAVLQDPRTVAETIRFVLSLPDESVIPEILVLPMRESSWP